MSGHAVVPDLGAHPGVLDGIRAEMARLGIGHVTIQLEVAARLRGVRRRPGPAATAPSWATAALTHLGHGHHGAPPLDRGPGPAFPRLLRPRTALSIYAPRRPGRPGLSRSKPVATGSACLIRNLAIIAHVDHGKTTLVDQMLRQAGRSAPTSRWKSGSWTPTRWSGSGASRSWPRTRRCAGTAPRSTSWTRPGHADFGGEVERILRMVDGVLILVDAAEGPMPQTRFVTRKALALGLRPIVAINKIDRSDAEPLRVHDEVLGLFIDLEATHEQLDAPFLYTSSRAGTATTELDAAGHRSRAAVPGHPRPRAGAQGRPRGAVPDAGLHARLLQLPRPDRHRPDRAGPGAGGRPGGAAAAGRARAGRATRPSSGTGSPRSTPSTGSTGSRWTRRPRATSWRSRASRPSRSARPSPSVERPERLAGHRGRGAHHLGGLHREQRPLRRPGREVRHQPPAQGPAVPRAGAERGAPGGGDRQPRHPHRLAAAASSTSAS